MESSNVSAYSCYKGLEYFYSAPDNKEFLFDKITDPNETRNRQEIRSTGYSGFGQKSLIAHLKSGGEVAALTSTWRRFDRQSFRTILMQDCWFRMFTHRGRALFQVIDHAIEWLRRAQEGHHDKQAKHSPHHVGSTSV